MDPNDVRELEVACEAALADVVGEYLENCSEHTAHLMAKAAVAVLEAVYENAEEDVEDD